MVNGILFNKSEVELYHFNYTSFTTATVVRHSACYSIYFPVNLKLCISLDFSIYSIIMTFKYCSNHPTSCTIIPYILKSNPHPFYSFRGLKN
jgi:hypothetical protein